MRRRTFLQLFSASALAAIAPFERLVTYQERAFVSPALGLSLTPPMGWHRPDLQEVIRNLSQQTFVADDLEPNEAPAPLVAFYKYPEPHPGMNPGIWVYADRVEPWMGSPVELADNYLESFGEAVLEPHCVQEPTAFRLCGASAATVTLQYRAVVESESFEHGVTDYSTITFHNGHLIWLLFEESAEGPEVARSEFDTVLKSVRLS